MNNRDRRVKADSFVNALEGVAEATQKLLRKDRSEVAKEFTSDLKALMKQGKKDCTIHGVQKYLNYLFNNLHELQNAEVRREIYRGVVVENIETTMRVFHVKNE